jgi:ribosomal protein S18 acetylase RimI-like enzyme
MQVVIRKASPNDTPLVKACIESAFDKYIERIGKPPAPMLLDFATEINANHVWLADADQMVIGVIVQYETDLGFYIDTVAVSPHFQGAGVGKALLQFAEEEAARRGYSSVYLCTNTKMTENQIFYPRLGYVEYERRFDSGYDRIFYRKQLFKGSSDNAA